MRMPRFRIRTSMIAVAAVAFLAAAGVEGMKIYRIANYYGQRAEQAKSAEAWHSQKLRKATRLKNDLVADVGTLSMASKPAIAQVVNELSEDLLRIQSQVHYHRLLYLKYEHAASHPWESVPLDPPKPQ